MARISAQELPSAAPCALEHVSRLQDLGILEPQDASGLFPSSDVHVGLQFFDRTVRQRVATFELSNEEKDSLVYRKAAGYTELVSALVPWLQRRPGSMASSSTSSP